MLRSAATVAVFCGGLGLAVGQAATETIVHSFKGGSDGANPEAGVLQVGSNLYGTTVTGGSADQGTVFRIYSTGHEKVIHAFVGGRDGSSPEGGLVVLNGVLYGTTTFGGSDNGQGDGTVFGMTNMGTETMLYPFAGGNDGAEPVVGLTKLGGSLYGVTSANGQWDAGTVFHITTSGLETPLYSFQNGNDGAYPQGGLAVLGGRLYGTTTDFGAHNYGMVFRITTAGVEKVIYPFKPGTDASVPLAAMIDVNGTLYGTTFNGGANGLGTVFSVTPSGVENVIYSFKGGNDGYNPRSTLFYMNGVLYGTTESGGGTKDAGTLFSVTPDGGVEHVLYSFAGGTDGQGPSGSLILFNNALYGTTYFGGAHGQGTVFAITNFQ